MQEKALEKCLSPKEKPYKREHSEAVVLKTHELRSCEHIWTFAWQHKVTLSCNTSWKFCCLMHKVLHEGHSNVLRDSSNYKERVLHCAQYWTRQNVRASACLASYCKVLHTKISFHQSYACFKGNLQLDCDLPLRDINIWYLPVACTHLKLLFNLFQFVFSWYFF